MPLIIQTIQKHYTLGTHTRNSKDRTYIHVLYIIIWYDVEGIKEEK